MAEKADGSDVVEPGREKPEGGDHGSDKPYHPKRPHRKSRNGCRNCKKRKVKCDEGKPSCRTCVLRKETSNCVYLSTRSSPSSPSGDTGGTLSPSPSGPSSAQPSPPPPSPPPSGLVIYTPPTPEGLPKQSDIPVQLQLQLLQEPMFLPPGRDPDDMKLLWAYHAHSYNSFVTKMEGVSQLPHVLQNKVLEYATDSPFLMDCILALTATHMQHLGNHDLSVSPSKSVLYRARTFSGYRRAVEAADPVTFPALIACSLLLCAVSAQVFLEDSSFSSSPPSPSSPTLNNNKNSPNLHPRHHRRLYILDWIIVWRGIGLIIDLTSPKKLGQSGLGVMFKRPPIDLDQSALHIPGNLLFMVASIQLEDGVDTPDDADVYYTALKYLGSLYRELDEHGFNPILDLRTVTFYTFVSKRFVELARERRPRALVIVAHHLALLKLVRSVWWTVGISDSQIGDICELLRGKRDWEVLLDVPRAAMGLREIGDIAKLLLDNHAWEPPPRDEIYKTHPDPREMWSAMWVNNSGREQMDFPERIEGG